MASVLSPPWVPKSKNTLPSHYYESFLEKKGPRDQVRRGRDPGTTGLPGCRGRCGTSLSLDVLTCGGWRKTLDGAEQGLGAGKGSVHLSVSVSESGMISFSFLCLSLPVSCLVSVCLSWSLCLLDTNRIRVFLQETGSWTPRPLPTESQTNSVNLSCRGQGQGRLHTGTARVDGDHIHQDQTLARGQRVCVHACAHECVSVCIILE